MIMCIKEIKYKIIYNLFSGYSPTAGQRFQIAKALLKPCSYHLGPNKQCQHLIAPPSHPKNI